MAITGIVPQLRTTDMASSIRFYTEKLGFAVEFKPRCHQVRHATPNQEPNE